MALIDPPDDVAIERYTGPHLVPTSSKVKESIYTGAKTVYESGLFRWRGTATIAQQSVRRDSEISLWLNSLRGQVHTTKLPLPLPSISAPGTPPSRTYTRTITDDHYMTVNYSGDMDAWDIETGQFLLFGDELYRVVKLLSRQLRVIPPVLNNATGQLPLAIPSDGFECRLTVIPPEPVDADWIGPYNISWETEPMR